MVEEGLVSFLRRCGDRVGGGNVVTVDTTGI